MEKIKKIIKNVVNVIIVVGFLLLCKNPTTIITFTTFLNN